MAHTAFSKPIVMKLVVVVNEGDAFAATKIIFIVMREKSYFWVDEFQIKVILS